MIHCVLPSLSRTVLPSSRRLNTFFFFFALYNSRWNKTDCHPLPAALGHNILFLRRRRDGDERARRAVTQQPAFTSQALRGDEKKPLNSCVRAEAAFWVSKDAPLLKNGKTQLYVMPDRPVAAMFDLDLGEL